MRDGELSCPCYSQSSLYSCPSQHRIVTENGGKVKVMELMAHESADVKYQALITVSNDYLA